MTDRVVPINKFDPIGMDINPSELFWLHKIGILTEQSVALYVLEKAGESPKWDDLYFTNVNCIGLSAELLSKLECAPMEIRKATIDGVGAQLVINWAGEAEINDEFFQRLADIWVRLGHPDWITKYLPFIPPEGHNPFQFGFSSAKSDAIREAKSILQKTCNP